MTHFFHGSPGCFGGRNAQRCDGRTWPGPWEPEPKISACRSSAWPSPPSRPSEADAAGRGRRQRLHRGSGAGGMSRCDLPAAIPLGEIEAAGQGNPPLAVAAEVEGGQVDVQLGAGNGVCRQLGFSTNRRGCPRSTDARRPASHRRSCRPRPPGTARVVGNVVTSESRGSAAIGLLRENGSDHELFPSRLSAACLRWPGSSDLSAEQFCSCVKFSGFQHKMCIVVSPGHGSDVYGISIRSRQVVVTMRR